MRKLKKGSLAWHKRRAWDSFSVYIRIRDWANQGKQHMDNSKGFSVKSANCITCNKMYPVEGVGSMQAGHFIPGRNNQVLFDEDFVWAQCYNCNVTLKGQWAKYYIKMVEVYDKEYVEEAINAHMRDKQYSIPELEEMKRQYDVSVENLINS